MSSFNDDPNHDDHGFYPFGNFDHGSSQSNFNKKILLTAICSLVLVLILVLALHLYARYVLKRQARRRAAIHQLSLTVAHAHVQFSDPSNSGLDPTLIASLPTFLFKQKQIQDEEQNKDVSNNIVECAVCLSLIEDGEMMRLLPNCKHSFHVACIDMWLASHSTCPICRTKVEPRLEPETREGPIWFKPSSESTSDGGDSISDSSKNIFRLSSFQRILTRDRSSRRIQPSNSIRADNLNDRDLERQ
ncbi:RING-H2 finger protein ATL40-like [Vicia villosa]|uniref:RING-H2 finger protein ATL40-like n=1 Tax=Vicia villosa TaxID=3911 RepID=UPI00273AF7DD|nr:RING-H2 finger protein ATL40-like [Vicia villosa]